MTETRDAVATMGNLLPDDVGGRDAVHVAVISVTAIHKLMPGQHIGFVEVSGEPYSPPGEDREVGGTSHPIGIVDPFLEAPVKPGERFWLFLYPRTITSLRHHWTHPDFPTEVKGRHIYSHKEDKEESELWIRDFLKQKEGSDYAYSSVLHEITKMLNGDADSYDDTLIFHGSDMHIYDIPDEFWKHMSVVLGREIKTKIKSFSCSC